MTSKSRICLSAASFLSISLAICAIVIFFIIESIIEDKISEQVSSQVVMTKDNPDQWGNLPGKYDVDLQRQITFFNFENAEEVFLEGKKPILKEKPSIFLKEKNEVFSISESDEGDLINFINKYSFYNEREGEADDPLEQIIEIPNVYALGVWITASKPDDKTAAFNGIAGLLSGLLKADSIYMGVLNSGVYTTVVEGKTFQEIYDGIFKNAGLTIEKSELIWNDPLFGWKQDKTFIEWVRAAQEGQKSDSAVELAKYFDLRSGVISKLTGRSSSIATSLLALKPILARAYGCPRLVCNSVYLANIQLTSQRVTAKPPSGPKNPSVASTNDTLYGYPEISYFQKEYFEKNIDPGEDYKNAVFGKKLAETLLEVDLSDPQNFTTVKKRTSLVHPKNLDFLLKAGEKFDENKDLEEFKKVVAMLQLESVYQARILYEYAKYMGQKFTTYYSEEQQLPVRATFFSQATSTIFQLMKDRLKFDLVTALAEPKLKDKDCEEVLTKSLGKSLPAETVVKFCENWPKKPFIKNWISYCNNRTTDNFKERYEETGLTKIQADEICDKDNDIPETLGEWFDELDKELGEHYGCRSGFCTEYELVARQWAIGDIVSNPPSGTSFKPGISFKDWYPDLIPSNVEFFLVEKSLSKLDLSQALQVLFWDGMFSNLAVVKGVVEAREGKLEYFQSKFFQTNIKAFESYMNKIIVKVAFGGFTIRASARDLLLGYHSQILQEAKDTSPLEGGDPSVDTVLGLMANNTEVVQTRNTGKMDLKMVNQYVNVNNRPFINLLLKNWDGDDVKEEVTNPWKEKVGLRGSDNVYAPGLGTETGPAVYISDFCRFGETVFTKEVKYGKIQSYRYSIDSKSMESGLTNPENLKYNMEKYNGAFNATIIFTSPIFITKVYLASMDDSEKQKVQMLDSENAEVEFEEERDDLSLDIQPDTGVPVRIGLCIQINAEIRKDTLFSAGFDGVIPIFHLRRKSLLNKEQRKEIFGDLVVARQAKFYIKWGMIPLAILLLVLAAICVYLGWRKGGVEIDKEDNYQEVLVESLTDAGKFGGEDPMESENEGESVKGNDKYAEIGPE